MTFWLFAFLFLKPKNEMQVQLDTQCLRWQKTNGAATRKMHGSTIEKKN